MKKEEREREGNLVPLFSQSFRLFLYVYVRRERERERELSACPSLSQPVEEVASHVERGYRMDSPDGCPEHIYAIMVECWHKDPSQRPNFARITKLLCPE